MLLRYSHQYFSKQSSIYNQCFNNFTTLLGDVDAARNHVASASYPQTYPLAYKNQSMRYWAAGYRLKFS